MDATTADSARDLIARLGEAKGPDRELDLRVYALVTGQPLEWVEQPQQGSERVWVRRVGDTAAAFGMGTATVLSVGGPAADGLPKGAIALPRLTASTDDSVAQVKAAGFNWIEVDFNLSDRLRPHLKDKARIHTWIEDPGGAVGRGPTRTGEGMTGGLAVCQALVLALLGKAGLLPDDD